MEQYGQVTIGAPATNLMSFSVRTPPQDSHLIVSIPTSPGRSIFTVTFWLDLALGPIRVAKKMKTKPTTANQIAVMIELVFPVCPTERKNKIEKISAKPAITNNMILPAFIVPPRQIELLNTNSFFIIYGNTYALVVWKAKKNKDCYNLSNEYPIGKKDLPGTDKGN